MRVLRWSLACDAVCAAVAADAAVLLDCHALEQQCTRARGENIRGP